MNNALKSILILCPVLFFFQNLNAQSYQTVKGTILESFTEKPVEGASIKIIKDGVSIAKALSGADGQFKIDQVELGTYDILFSHVSFNSFISPGVEISMSKEIVLNILMEAKINTLDGVEVTPPKLRGQPSNNMASTSSYSIQADDAKRIAGGLDDPIRVAGTLPGVTSSPGFSENFISIRGNSPRTLKYQMEGIELANPTHFSRIGSSGGTFTIFSLQLLDKSDFYTGAFSAEYGNALGGVFDAKLRKGNNEKHEHILQVGVLGIDLASEGPLSKKNKASYAVNYRYGLVGLARLIGYPTQPTYQDLSLTVNFPLTLRSNLKLFAIGGTSLRDRTGESDSTLWEESLDRTNLLLESSMMTAGLVFKHFIRENTVFKFTGAASYTDQSDNKQYITDSYSLINQRTNEYSSRPVSMAVSVKHKFSKRHYHITGGSWNITWHKWLASRYFFNSSNLVTLFDGHGYSSEAKAYTQSKFLITKKLTLNLGIHLFNYNVNNNTVVEPRAHLNYKIAENHSLSASFGMHSQAENYATYFVFGTDSLGQLSQPNNNLDLVRSNHFVIGYKGKVWTNHRLRVEAYYQQLYDVPVSPSGAFSTLNIAELQDLRALTNAGTGENYGLDFGFERYTDNGLYYILNASVYRSLYTAADGIERSTGNDNQYNIKFLIGKEYKLRKKEGKYKAFSWNTNLATVGGQPYTPINLALSEIEQETVLDETQTNSLRDNPLVYLDFTFSYKINKNNRRNVWTLQIKNLFSNGNAIYREYDTILMEEVTVPSSSIFPVISYRLEF